jgi:hypothetical protein
MAITEEERKFLVYWEAQRNKERKLTNQLMFGLPIGILFSVPLIINFFMGKFWYKRADAVGISQFDPTVLVLAVLLITIFVALLNRRFRWEKLEQQYLEIKVKEMKG